MPFSQVVLTEFGGPENLEMRTVETVPEPERGEVRVRVLVTSAAYAILTPQGWPLMLWAFGFGLLLGGLRLFSENLWPSAAAHLVVALTPRLIEVVT